MNEFLSALVAFVIYCYKLYKVKHEGPEQENWDDFSMVMVQLFLFFFHCTYYKKMYG